MVANHESNENECYRVILIGDGAVGKSSIMLRYCENEFDARHMMTIGVDFKTKTLELKNGDKIRLQIWDTAGQERFRNITPVYFRSSNGIALVYDVTSVESFENVTYWLASLETNGCSDKPKVLIGNKIDLLPRKVSRRRGEALASKHQIMYFETSALENIGIDEVFLALASMIREKQGRHHDPAPTPQSAKPFQLSDPQDSNHDSGTSIPNCCMRLWQAMESYRGGGGGSTGGGSAPGSSQAGSSTPTTAPAGGGGSSFDISSSNAAAAAAAAAAARRTSSSDHRFMAVPSPSNAKQQYTRVSTSGRVLSGVLSRKSQIDH